MKNILLKSLILVVPNILIWFQIYQLHTVTPQIIFLNIGQGDATLIQDRFTQIIIDAGPDETILTQINNLFPINDKTIESVIITHPHQDHYQGLIHLLDYYIINQIILPQVDGNSSTYQLLLAEINHRQIPTIKADNFTQIQTKNIFIQFIYPFKNKIPSELADLNDISNSMIVFINNKKIAITGDLSQTIENQLVEKYGSNLDADILKVGHHGSKTSSSDNFIKTVKPDTAVISVGENTFGHPHQNTLNNLEQNKIEIWRTDLDGTLVDNS